MANRTALQKRLSYRLPVAEIGEAAALQQMHDHWSGFTWLCGPVIVKWNSDTHPQVQVWAATEAEGKRVVRHALAHMQAIESDGYWQVSVCSDNRYGRIATVRATILSARIGPTGVAPKRWIYDPE